MNDPPSHPGSERQLGSGGSVSRGSRTGVIAALTAVGVLGVGSALAVAVVLSRDCAERAGVAHPPPAAQGQPSVPPAAPSPPRRASGGVAPGLPTARAAVDTVITAYSASNAATLRRIRCQDAPGESRLPAHLPPGIGMRLIDPITETGGLAEGPVTATFDGKQREFAIQVKNEGGGWCYYADRTTS